jgi:hypothetical protein
MPSSEVAHLEEDFGLLAHRCPTRHSDPIYSDLRRPDAQPLVWMRVACYARSQPGSWDSQSFVARVRAGAKLQLPLGLHFWYTVNMKKSITVHQKPRGRPATGRDPAVTIRLPEAVLASVEHWAMSQKDQPPRSQAIRRLVELGLTVKSRVRSSSGDQKLRAREMAGKAIDHLTDATAHADDQVSRKRQLLKGPEEFREVRIDRLKVKK